MRKVLITVLSCCLYCIAITQNKKQVFISSDIDNFWKAYEKINSTSDSASQYKLLQELYLNKASLGLKGIIEVRNYSEKEFIDWITKYPKFWASIKPNTLKVKSLYPDINADIQKLKKVYPELKPSPIYFTIGAFRSGGTIQGQKVLIGSELSMADKSTFIDELPAWRQPFYKIQNPLKEIALLCTHEYIHTQQKDIVENLLLMCLYEGVAEFISCHATGKKSAAPAIEFGKANRNKVVEKFVSDLFLMTNDFNWVYGENRNELKIRDLGYYIGYEICERYYTMAKNKSKAIKELIELDFNNEKAVEHIVDTTHLLPKSLEELYADYERQRPTVIAIIPFQNGSQNIKPGMTKITVQFSEPLVRYNTGVDFGPLGQDYFPKMNPDRNFSEDGRSWTFEAELKPNRHYQILISNNFRKENGVRLKPFLIDFKTSD